MFVRVEDRGRQAIGSSQGLRALSQTVVERTIAWIYHSRRLAKDFETHVEIAAAYLQTAMIKLLTRRLARV